MFKGLVTRHLHDEENISLHNVGNNPEMRRLIEHRKPQQSTVPSPGNFSAFREGKISPSKNPATGPDVLTFTPLHPTIQFNNIFLLLNKCYNSCRVLAFSAIFFQSRRSWACSDHLRSFILLRSFLTSSSHLCLGLPAGRVTYSCHLYIFLTILVSGFLFTCPNQLNLWALT